MYIAVTQDRAAYIRAGFVYNAKMRKHIRILNTDTGEVLNLPWKDAIAFAKCHGVLGIDADKETLTFSNYITDVEGGLYRVTEDSMYKDDVLILRVKRDMNVLELYDGNFRRLCGAKWFKGIFKYKFGLTFIEKRKDYHTFTITLCVTLSNEDVSDAHNSLSAIHIDFVDSGDGNIMIRDVREASKSLVNIWLNNDFKVDSGTKARLKLAEN